MLKKALALALAFVLCLGLAGCERGSAGKDTGGSDDGPIVIKIGHTDSNTRSTHVWSVWLGDYLEEKAPGRFKVEVYSDGALGDSPDMVAGVKLGTLTMEFDLSSGSLAARRR